MGRRKTFNRLPEAKQLAKQLILHRLWDGKTQDTVAKLLGVTFQQYQKLERCENRVFAEQLMLLCQEYKWDPQIIFFADPEANYSNDVDLIALTRLAILHDTPIVCSPAAADLVMLSFN